MKVLVACEESQTVCKAFRNRGHEAYSADIQEPSGGHPEWHILGDVIPLIDGNCTFKTMDGVEHTIDGEWDLLIAHPPCTYLSNAGARWLFPNHKLNQERYAEGIKAKEFFLKFWNANCKKIAIENPVGYMGSNYRKCDQTIQPYQFGEQFEKLTCLWLKGLPKLKETNKVEPPKRQRLKSGKSMPEWYSNAPKKERAKIRSKTFPGIAEAFATQWG